MNDDRGKMGKAQKQGAHLETKEGVKLETTVPWAPVTIFETPERHGFVISLGVEARACVNGFY